MGRGQGRSVKDDRNQEYVGKDLAASPSARGKQIYQFVYICMCVKAGEGTHREWDYYSSAELVLPVQIQEPLTENPQKL